MNSEVSLVEEVRFSVLSRRIKIIGIVIIVALFITYLAGLFVTASYVNKDFAILNLISLIACTAMCIVSIYIRKALLSKVNSKNFINKYFSTHIISFAICETGGLFSITTNLFINSNIMYASVSVLIAIIYVFLNFPRHGDLGKLNLEKGV
ncbi:MAG: hypothetical protein OZ913_09630 [Ignavibacteriaceae bacterium]|jgi:hypothetical protein|nr:MAG: hypothetical protein EDM69_06280 [Chlorobiota bacterium]KXK06481.1 MAG: hypothetical protein UZ04_CHB001000486 [Chlorobi bacterium OLB4]MBV6399705.1 hypothetical protein [Ignavibacteria bacterium]MCC6885221.1 hypothetical protein [Ignavibacteriales bacterium]MCE7953376.1 hypothetical protein [Chlorobi bacterium CHB7]MDL1887208.1 hypothetical protein [Ignavibacteria bacterium CHB1]MEB2330541.1 hypothetical protein [Ignavibacteriaceae bacterium]OQY78148.1 MAG: hypothetical protein B6D4